MRVRKKRVKNDRCETEEKRRKREGAKIGRQKIEREGQHGTNVQRNGISVSFVA